MKRKNIILTNHAIKRAKEAGIGKEKLKDLFLGSSRLKTNIFREAVKLFKYGGVKQGDVYYYFKQGSSRYPSLLFTVSHKEHVSEEGEWVIITVTKRKMKDWKKRVAKD